MNTIVVGGGFGGVKAALELSKRHVGKITLISDETYLLHHATLYATATGKSRTESVLPLNDIFEGHSDVTVVHDKIKTLDAERKIVIGDNGQYEYDNLVIGVGSITTYFNINGMEQHAYGIKSLDEIANFRKHIHNEVVEQKLDAEYFVIGAGPTGVELAGALNEYLRQLKSVNRIKHSKAHITIVEAAPRILPRSTETATKVVGRRLKKLKIKVLVHHQVQALDDNTITISGKQTPTTTAVWTSGVANNPFFQANAHIFNLAPNGRVNVNPYLEAMPHVYVIGDNNTVKFSGMAWPAMKQATYVAKRLAKLKKHGHSAPFKPHSVMSGLPVGEGWGYVEWHGIYVSGRFGSWVRRRMELHGYRLLVPARKAKMIWQAHDIAEVDAN